MLIIKEQTSCAGSEENQQTSALIGWAVLFSFELAETYPRKEEEIYRILKEYTIRLKSIKNQQQ